MRQNFDQPLKTCFWTLPPSDDEVRETDVFATAAPNCQRKEVSNTSQFPVYVRYFRTLATCWSRNFRVKIETDIPAVFLPVGEEDLQKENLAKASGRVVPLQRAFFVEELREELVGIRNPSTTDL